jgi:hypothetical protein
MSDFMFNFDNGEVAENPMLFVLVNGETVMGTCIDDGDGGAMTLEDIVTFAPNGQGSVGTIPYLMFSKDNVAQFNWDQIRHVLEPTEELKEYYSKQFGKIVVPDSNVVIS